MRAATKFEPTILRCPYPAAYVRSFDLSWFPYQVKRDVRQEPRADVDPDLRLLLNAITASSLPGDAMIESDWLDLCQRWQDGL